MGIYSFIKKKAMKRLDVRLMYDQNTLSFTIPV